jgi:hypothetical protein
MITNLRIHTFTGKQVDPLNLQPEDIYIEDIAHSLAKQCRFGGHVKTFYSVAEHSYRMSYAVSKPLALCALLHDASEAYLIDLPRPVKRALPSFVELEESIQEVISRKFKIPYPFPEEIHEVDTIMAVSEADILLEGGLRDWAPDIASKSNPNMFVDSLNYFSQSKSYFSTLSSLFLARFHDLNQTPIL